MDYIELINTRESMRDFDPHRPVTKEVLEKILEAGRLAPSACNIQPWEFIVVSSQDYLEKVRAAYPRQWFINAPHVLVIVGLKDKAWKRSFDNYCSIETDVTIAMTHMILAAENEGVGTCWVANYNPLILKEALKIEDDKVVFAITPLGYPKQGFRKTGNKIRKSLDDIVRFM